MSTGSWVGQQEHIYDKGLGMALLSFFRHKNAESVLDLGAGDGSYVQMLRQGGLRAGCFDGNPAVRELSQKRCLQADLSEEHDFGQRWDWVMSIEVAEHVPHVFERTYLNNLERHSCEGIIISWANPFQQGKGHVNGKPWREVQRLFEDRGFWYDANSSASLRRKSRLGWFRQNIMEGSSCCLLEPEHAQKGRVGGNGCLDLPQSAASFPHLQRQRISLMLFMACLARSRGCPVRAGGSESCVSTLRSLSMPMAGFKLSHELAPSREVSPASGLC
eukprot:symbB.v1.2.031473.t1/scaffold3658.1/size52500/4